MLFQDYGDEKYFLRPPRMVELIKDTEITIESPAKDENSKELPMILAMGSIISLGVMNGISVIQTIDNFIHGQLNRKDATFSLITSGIMILSSLLLPLIIQQYTFNQKNKDKKNKIKNYRKYIENKKTQIEKIIEKNKNILESIYSSNKECMQIIENQTARLWERKASDEDFLTVRLGNGEISSHIKLKYNKEDGVDSQSGNSTDFELQELMDECIEEGKKISNAPVLLSLTEKRVSAIITENESEKNSFIRNILLQLVTFQSYDELRLVCFLRNQENRTWDFIKMLPHVWNGSKTVRYFADDFNRIKEISQYLEEEYKKRLSEEMDFNYRDVMPYYLIIIDDYSIVENLTIIRDIMNMQENLGFSVLIITNDINTLPNECQTFVALKDGQGVIFENKNSLSDQTRFNLEIDETIAFDRISQILSNIPIKYSEEKSSMLPSSYTFLEMYGVGRIDQLNILERWKKNDSTTSLAVPLGVDGSGNHIELDIHEKYHGPHGLVAGSTGSGKSEFIITYILSLAVNFHPDDVTFVLIDYKGGGLTGAFEKPDVRLPHLVGTITNIDKSGLARSLESIESELKRRQIEFNEAKIITNESTMDIYKYQRLYHAGALKKPISHLFIISDEFAELKEQEPEFIEELVSIARIGRSLGVHLILATQQPSGVVSDQIRSNAKFGICLKVQSPADSNDMIGIPDGASLKGSGQFYLKVGNNDYLALGQSAWAGAQYYPSNEIKKEFDNSIEFISSTGMVLKKIDDEKKTSHKSHGEQITNIVKYLNDLAKRENINAGQLWLENIPENIYLKNLREKYKVPKEKYVINPVIGEYDNPSKQLQNVKTLNFSKEGNTIIYGNAESGKETLLGSIIYDIITNYTPDEVNLYIMDFGSEAMKIFRKAPHVGDIIFAAEEEKFGRFLKMLQAEIKTRKEILSEYNGDYRLYLKTTGKVMPTYIVMLNNYETYLENYEMNYDDWFQMLIREGERCGMYFLIVTTSSNGMRYRMAQNFKQSIALQMNNDDEFSMIFDGVGRKRPSRLFGRGLIYVQDEGIFEFQTAKICDGASWNEQIMQTIEQLNQQYKTRAPSVPTVPEVVQLEHIQSGIKDLTAVPLGIIQRSIKVSTYNLYTSIVNLIATKGETEDIKDFITNFVKMFESMPNVNFALFDADHVLSDKKEDLLNKYFSFFKALNHAEGEIPESVYIVIGIKNFLKIFGEHEEMFYESLKNAQRLEKCRMILIDNYNQIQNYEDEDWYGDFVSVNSGVWIGNGAESQGLLEITEETAGFSNNCGNTYGYVIKKGKPILVKMLGMEEKKDEDEDE